MIGPGAVRVGRQYLFLVALFAVLFSRVAAGRIHRVQDTLGYLLTIYGLLPFHLFPHIRIAHATASPGQQKSANWTDRQPRGVQKQLQQSAR